jgi:hypothetical protein
MTVRMITFRLPCRHHRRQGRPRRVRPRRRPDLCETRPGNGPVGISVSLRCVEHGANTASPARCPERGKKFVNEGLADGSFKPRIAERFPLEQIVEAHRFLESNQQIGVTVGWWRPWPTDDQPEVERRIEVAEVDGELSWYRCCALTWASAGTRTSAAPSWLRWCRLASCPSEWRRCGGVR